MAFSTPTGISLGGSSEPLTLSPDHKPWVVGKVVDSERMVLCEEEVVTIIKNQIPLQLGRQVPSESLLRLLLELFSLKVVK